MIIWHKKSLKRGGGGGGINEQQKLSYVVKYEWLHGMCTKLGKECNLVQKEEIIMDMESFCLNLIHINVNVLSSNERAAIITTSIVVIDTVRAE